MWQFTNPQHSTDKEVLLELPNFPVGLLYVVWRYFFENKRSPKTFFNQLYTLLFNGVILSTKIPEKWYCKIYIFFRFVKRRFFLWVIKSNKRQNRPCLGADSFQSLLTSSRYLLFCKVVSKKYFSWHPATTQCFKVKSGLLLYHHLQIKDKTVEFAKQSFGLDPLSQDSMELHLN